MPSPWATVRDTWGRGGGLQMHFFPFFSASQGGGFFFIFCIFFCIFFGIYLMPSISFYRGNPWTNLRHMHHFDGGVCANAFICKAVFAVSTCIPPPLPELRNGNKFWIQ